MRSPWVHNDPHVIDIADRRPNGDWFRLAACNGMDPELWFPTEKAPKDAAERGKAICWGLCRVRAECLAYANANGERWGTWGGYSESEVNVRLAIDTTTNSNQRTTQP